MAALLSGAVYLYLGARSQSDAAGQDLRRAARLAETIVDRDTRHAALMSKLLAESYAVRAELASNDAGALNAQMEKELKSLDTDFISVADAGGVVVAHAQRPRADGMPAESHEGEPLFLSRIFQRSVKTNAMASGVETLYPNTIAVTAVAPVRGAQGRIEGFLRLGYRLDEKFAENIKEFTNVEVAVESAGALSASTLGETGVGKEALTRAELSKRYLTMTSPIGNSGARLVVASPKSRIERVERQGLFLGAGILAAAFALASLLSLRLTARITRPLNALMDGVRRVGSGDMRFSIPEIGNDEVSELAGSFNRMTEALARRDDELRKNQEQIVQSGKLAAIGELAAGVAHEIGNPLAAVSGYIQLLRAQNPGEQSAHYLDMMEKEVGFIDTTIRELIEFARPDSEERETVDLNETAEEALRILSFHKSSGDVKIVRKLSEKGASTVGSRKEVMQAALNVALNAVQAMPGGGTMEFVVAAAGEHTGVPEGRTGILVSDTGPGIPEESMRRIFDPFYTTKPGGTGLGLSITYRIVERHSGKMTVENRPGGGVTFKLLFPAAGAGR